MSDFDPQDLAVPTNSTPPSAGAMSGASDFDPQDVVSASPPTNTQSPQKADFDPSDMVHPSTPNKFIQPEETAQIAAKYKVDPQKLESIAPYYGVNLISKQENPASFAAKSVAGEVGNTALLGAPQYAYRQLALSEPERRALDELKATSEERKGGLERAVEFGRGFVAPVVGIPRMLPQAAGRAAQFVERLAGSTAVGAAAGAMQAPEGQEAEGAKQGAIWGSILHTGLEGVGAIARIAPRATERSVERQAPDIESAVGQIHTKTQESEGIAADTMAGILDTGEVPKLSDEEVATISKQQFPENPEPDRQAAESFVEKRMRDYAQDLTGETPRNMDQAATLLKGEETRGPQYLAERYEDFVKGQMAERAQIQINKQRGFWGRAADFISDAQYVARDIDSRTGTTLEPTLNQLNKDYNKSTYKLADWRKRLDQVFRANQKSGVDGDQLYTEMIHNQVAPEHQAAASNVRGFFQDFLKEQTSPGEVAPLGTRKMENYLPEYAKPVAEIIPIVEGKMDVAKAESSQILGRQVQDLSTLNPQELQKVSTESPAMADVLQFAKWGQPQSSIQDGRQLGQILDTALNSDRGRAALEITAKSSLERQGGTPDFLKEKNVYKLMSMYTANTVRAMYLRKGIDQLRYQMQTLEKAGANQDAQYIHNLIQDIQGTRSSTAAAANRDIRTNFYRKMDQMIAQFGGRDSTVGGGLTAVKALPEVLREISLQIYPATMGLNFHSALQHSLSSVTKLAPEMGGTYGYKTTAKAALMALRNFREQYAQVRSQGMMPEGFVRNGEAAIAEGLQASSLYQIPRKVLDGMSTALLSLHQAAEVMNRVIVKNAGEIMGREIAAGSRGAEAALNRFPRTIRRRVEAAQGDPTVIGDILAKHLNDTTSYNYNRMSMNQFGRSMGPMFSVFTKWPAATAGDILATMREKGALRGSARVLEKYLAPALLLHTASMAVLGHSFLNPSDDMSDREKLMAGHNGLVGSAPINTVLGLARGEVGLPPAVAIGYHGILQPLLEGKGLGPESAQKVAGEFASSFTPGAGIIRFLTQDLATYVTGHRPEGDFFQKTAEGYRRLTK